MHSIKCQAFNRFLKFCILNALIFSWSVCADKEKDHSYSHTQDPYSEKYSGSYKQPDKHLKTSCSRFHEISTFVQPGLTTVNVVHFLDEPMIAGYGIDDEGVAVAVWYTYDLGADSYELNTIGNCSLKNAEVRGFDDIERKGKYYAAACVGNLNNLPIETNITILPPPNAELLFLDSPAPDKRSECLILILTTTNSALSSFNVYQVLPAQDVGNVTVFKLATDTNLVQDCALFPIFNEDTNFEARIYCFPPLDVEPDDEAVHKYQLISVNGFPLLTNLFVDKTTFVVMVASDEPVESPEKPNEVNRNVASVWTHAPTDDAFASSQEIKIPYIITVDSLLTADDLAFLALGSRPDLADSDSGSDEGQACTGLISIYLYDKEEYKFKLSQSLHVENLVQVRFLLVQETEELLLIELSKDVVKNIHIYSFKGAKGWVSQCSVTVPGASFLETFSFVFQDEFRAQIITVTSTGATVVAIEEYTPQEY